MGYIMGVYDGNENELFFVPSGVTGHKFYNIVGKYLDNHPEEWNKSAADLVIKALQTVFL